MAASTSKSESKSEDKKDEGGRFQCSTCDLNEKYHYYGRTPRFAKHFVFNEDSYIARDLLSPKDQALFLLLGSKCSVCQKDVCQKQECSIFYAKRFCISCAKSNLSKFPPEIVKLIQKAK